MLVVLTALAVLLSPWAAAELMASALENRPPEGGRIGDRALYPPDKDVSSSNLERDVFHALLIAVQNYDHESVTDLDHPITEAKSLQETLTRRYRFAADHVTLLEDPDREQILGAFEDLERELGPGDSLLIFFAGHGVWRESIQQGYWLPADARKRNRSAWISNSDIRDAIYGIPSRHTLLISDACFSGGIFKERFAFPAADKAIQELFETPSRKAMTSGMLKTVPDQSVFLRYLKQRLEANEDPFLTANQLFSSFRQAVINNTSRSNKPQYGVIAEAGDEGGEFVFVRRVGSKAAPPVAADRVDPATSKRRLAPDVVRPSLEIDLAALGPGSHLYPDRQVTITGELNLDGEPFELEAARLIADVAVIRSFAGDHLRAESGAAGRTPGSAPARGLPGVRGTPGDDGEDGRNASRIRILADEFSGRLLLDTKGQDGGAGGQGGNGGRGGDGESGPRAQANAFACVTPAGAGQGGGRGGHGGRGGDGGDGGDAGRIAIRFGAVEPGTTIEAIAVPGRGGSAGNGGEAGRPGRGGPGGRSFGLCQQPGADGAPGESGEDGVPGNHGGMGAQAEIELVIAGQREVLLRRVFRQF